MRQRHLLAVAGILVAVVGGYALLGGSGDPTGKLSQQQVNQFAQCLSEQDATFYGASWCPHCNQQKVLLGDAMQYVDYVECSPEGKNAPQADVCASNDIASYPTWIIDGERYKGMLDVNDLASATGCQPPE